MEIKYYLHDNHGVGEMAEYLESKGVSPDVARKAAEMRPFYEVTLVCDLNEETGEVTLKWASL